MIEKPHIIEFNKIGSKKLGYISVAEFEDQIPFEIKRVYWTYYTPKDVQRGYHAHKRLSQVIVAVSGVIKIKLIDYLGNELLFVLDDPSKGLFIPKMYWREISFSLNSVLLCLASDIFDENDYIRNFNDFNSRK